MRIFTTLKYTDPASEFTCFKVSLKTEVAVSQSLKQLCLHSDHIKYLRSAMTTCNSYKETFWWTNFLIYLKSKRNQKQDTLPTAITVTAPQPPSNSPQQFITPCKRSTIPHVLWRLTLCWCAQVSTCTFMKIYCHENPNAQLLINTHFLVVPFPMPKSVTKEKQTLLKFCLFKRNQ